MAASESEAINGDLDDTIETVQSAPALQTLTRCASTPQDGRTLFLVSPPPGQASLTDSGFESGVDLSGSSEKSVSRGAFPKRAITRSRTRHWSGSLESSPSTSCVLKKSWLSFNLRKYPNDECDKKPRFVYKPPKPGLVLGFDKLDLIKRLHNMGTYHILAKIWKCLSIQDIANILQVSTKWNCAIQDDHNAMERYHTAKERYNQNPIQQLEKQNRIRLRYLGPRETMSEISNLLLSPVKKVPPERQRRSPRLNNGGTNELTKPIMVSPSKFRHRLFAEEAQRLAPDEKLQPCPRCTCPSRVTPNDGKAQCSRISCQYEFCTLCLCTFHKGSPCRITRGCKIRNSTPQTSTNSPTDSSGCYSKARVSSKVSKRRLKRL